MTIVVDINCLPAVFSPEAQNHHDFAPVQRFIENGIGVLVYGGSKYLQELGKMTRYARTVRLMSEQGRAVKIDSEAVDRKQAELERILSGSDCDDPHIVALLAVSNCGLLCSIDHRSFPHVKNRHLYPNDHIGVKIYTGCHVTHLLIRQRQTIKNCA
jgi:hypothetical protein